MSTAGPTDMSPPNEKPYGWLSDWFPEIVVDPTMPEGVISIRGENTVDLIETISGWSPLIEPDEWRPS